MNIILDYFTTILCYYKINNQIITYNKFFNNNLSSNLKLNYFFEILICHLILKMSTFLISENKVKRKFDLKRSEYFKETKYSPF